MYATEQRSDLLIVFPAVDHQWFEVLDGLLGPYWKAAGLAFNCTFLLFGTVIQLIACARSVNSRFLLPCISVNIYSTCY